MGGQWEQAEFNNGCELMMEELSSERRSLKQREAQAQGTKMGIRLLPEFKGLQDEEPVRRWGRAMSWEETGMAWCLCAGKTHHQDADGARRGTPLRHHHVPGGGREQA